METVEGGCSSSVTETALPLATGLHYSVLSSKVKILDNYTHILLPLIIQCSDY